MNANKMMILCFVFNRISILQLNGTTIIINNNNNLIIISVLIYSMQIAIYKLKIERKTIKTYLQFTDFG